MWFEWEYLKTKKKMNQQFDPDMRFAQPKSAFDKVMVATVWIMIAAMAVGFIYRGL